MQLTPQQWMLAHAQGREVFKQTALGAARARLTGLAGTLRTDELTESLWPNRFAQGEAIEVRKQLVNVVLKAASAELSDCARRSPTTGGTFFGKVKRPWQWHAPEPRVVLVKEYPPEELRARLIELYKREEPGSLLPAFTLARLVDQLLAKAQVTLNTSNT